MQLAGYPGADQVRPHIPVFLATVCSPDSRRSLLTFLADRLAPTMHARRTHHFLTTLFCCVCTQAQFHADQQRGYALPQHGAESLHSPQPASAFGSLGPAFDSFAAAMSHGQQAQQMQQAQAQAQAFGRGGGSGGGSSGPGSPGGGGRFSPGLQGGGMGSPVRNAQEVRCVLELILSTCDSMLCSYHAVHCLRSYEAEWPITACSCNSPTVNPGAHPGQASIMFVCPFA